MSSEVIMVGRIINLTDAILEHAAELRSTAKKFKVRRLEIPDSLIASTAILGEYTLVTRDSDFKKVSENLESELAILDPFQ